MLVGYFQGASDGGLGSGGGHNFRPNLDIFCKLGLNCFRRAKMIGVL